MEQITKQVSFFLLLARAVAAACGQLAATR
jgi:hypothetical protein